jgi:PIN domain nuclease of toxin-antitoxin system
LWWLTNSASLTKQARGLIADPENTVFVSAVSLWEMWLKVSLNELRFPGDFADRLAYGDGIQLVR